MMVVEATQLEHLESGHNGQEIASKIHKLDCIYDDKPLGFEKDTPT